MVYNIDEYDGDHDLVISSYVSSRCRPDSWTAQYDTYHNGNESILYPPLIPIHSLTLGVNFI